MHRGQDVKENPTESKEPNAIGQLLHSINRVLDVGLCLRRHMLLSQSIVFENANIST